MLLGTGAIPGPILEARLDEIIDKSASPGTQSLDAASCRFWMGELITLDAVLANADSPEQPAGVVATARQSFSATGF